jgi:protocatechuate 3,4-dioxygenase beta subunit
VSATLRNSDGLMLEMMAGNAVGPAPSTPTSGYAATYFPGTASAADAQKITISVGQEAQGTDFALLAVRLARITGVVLNSEGKPVDGAMITATPARGLEGPIAMLGGSARTNKDGSFTLPNVAPGDYTLQVRSMTITTSAAGDSMTFSTRILAGGGDAEFASLPLSVSGDDLSNVVITTTKGGSATGRITFDGNRPQSIDAVRVTAMPAEMEGPGIMGGMGGSTTKPDGTFELKGLVGQRLLRVAGLPQGWVLKAVSLNGSDVTDTGIEFKGTDAISGIEVVVTSQASQVSGSVTQSDGAAVKDYTVVVFAEDPQKWTMPSSRWVNGVRPDQEGHFRVQNLPPGNYYAIAVEYVAQGEWGDPDVLDRLKSKAKRFMLTEGENKTLDLKLTDSY